jgi:hypothetical protein
VEAPQWRVSAAPGELRHQSPGTWAEADRGISTPARFAAPARLFREPGQASARLILFSLVVRAGVVGHVYRGSGWIRSDGPRNTVTYASLAVMLRAYVKQKKSELASAHDTWQGNRAPTRKNALGAHVPVFGGSPTQCTCHRWLVCVRARALVREPVRRTQRACMCLCEAQASVSAAKKESSWAGITARLL